MSIEDAVKAELKKFRISGHKAAPADHRLNAMLVGAPTATVSGPVDLRQYLPPPRSQGNDEACTSYAGAFLTSALVKIATGQSLEHSSEFVWGAERMAEGDMGQNTGCMSEDDLAVLVNDGDCLLATMPDQLGNYNDCATPAAIAEAAKYKLTNPARVDYGGDFAGANSVLAATRPLLISITVYQGLFDTLADGLVDAGALQGDLAGGHEILEVGFRSDGRRIWYFGSWPGFGDNCACYVDPAVAQQLLTTCLTACPPAV